MSEYQYYEFQAIDRPLTEKEMRELRSFSTRARITPTSFVNDYSWGGFKGNADEWMEKYFDAFLYYANWGTRVLKLRLPSELLSLGTVQEYCSGDSASVWEADGKIILSLFCENEGGGEWMEGEGSLSFLISIRAEMAHGDLRPLYLCWLLGAQSGEFDSHDKEPPVPAGLKEPSASLRSFAEFLLIDSDLVQVAAGPSLPQQNDMLERSEVQAWVAAFPAAEKDNILTRLVMDGEQACAWVLRKRFCEKRAGDAAGPTVAPAARRSVDELLEAARLHKEQRLRLEAERLASEKERRVREAVIARQRYLDGIAGRKSLLWNEVDVLVATRQPKRYDRAVELLIDLRDLDARSATGEFQLLLEALRKKHAGKPSFIKRLGQAGL
jgi:hypothetical protein